jgi:hypothetical protein
MKFKWIGLAVVAAAISFGSNAFASLVYSNPYDPAITGNCMFSSICGTAQGKPNDFGAQSFTLAATTTIQSASFTELDVSTSSTAVNWMFLRANGAGGLPGTLVASGASSIFSTTVGLWGVRQSSYTINQENFDVGSVTLNAGTYYFAVHSTSSAYSTYLSTGSTSSGAAETPDGGLTWTGTYQTHPSIAISLDSTALSSAVSAVPEPSTWAMMLLGFAGVGFMGYRRRKSALAVA